MKASGRGAPSRWRRAGFTIIEMLVVMAVVMILAGLLLPALSQAKERVKETTCLNNLHQIGICGKMWWDDTGGTIQGLAGGREALPGCWSTNFGVPEARSLYSYLKKSEVWRCPKDAGKYRVHFQDHPDNTLLPTCWETRGYSYDFNSGFPIGLKDPYTKRKVAYLITGKPDTSIPNPSLMILMFEPPAAPQACHCPRVEHFKPRWYQWHRRRALSIFLDPRLAPPLFYSPILFLDGHASVCNFTKALRTDPYHPFEETKEWMWYIPEPDRPPPTLRPL